MDLWLVRHCKDGFETDALLAYEALVFGFCALTHFAQRGDVRLSEAEFVVLDYDARGRKAKSNLRGDAGRVLVVISVLNKLKNEMGFLGVKILRQRLQRVIEVHAHVACAFRCLWWQLYTDEVLLAPNALDDLSRCSHSSPSEHHSLIFL